jgi:hypothetical protein
VRILAFRPRLFANRHLCDGVFFAAVGKSFLICFLGFAKLLNPGLLQLGFSGRACDGRVWAQWDSVLRRCDYASNAETGQVRQAVRREPVIRNCVRGASVQSPCSLLRT